MSYRIIPKSEWGGRAARSSQRVARSRRRTFVVHYDGATPVTRTGNSVPQAIQNYHMNGQGWRDGGYNFVVDQAGAIYAMRGWDEVGAHAGSVGNVEGIGVQVAIGGNQHPSDAALRSLVWLKKEADRVCGRVLAWRNHGDYMATSCAGGPLRTWLAGDRLAADVGAVAPADPRAVSGPDALYAGSRLVAHGFDRHYKVGPSRTWTGVDVANLREFQMIRMGRYYRLGELDVETKVALGWGLYVSSVRHAVELHTPIDVRLLKAATLKLGVAPREAVESPAWWNGDLGGDVARWYIEAQRNFQRSINNHPVDGRLGPKQWALLGRRSGMFEGIA